MKKFGIIVVIIFIIIIGVIFGINIYNSRKGKEQNIVQNEINQVSKKIVDDCVDEWEYLNERNNIDIETNSSEEKISPNCLVTLKRYYKKCNHMINEYVNIQDDLVNKTIEDLKKEYFDWQVQEYSSTRIVLYKEYEGVCGQHFVLRDKDGKIIIYRINENNEEEEYESTEISTEYLTETDKLKIQEGIKVIGKEELNQLIEDFE